jgi:polyisoprenyl-teichoic acid--peptidoglycan teichoic acid transferase
MDTFKPGGRRSLDGPVRRRPAPPPTTTFLTTGEPAEAEPQIDAPVPSSDRPVFEYRRPRRSRAGFWRYARIAAIGLVVVGVAAGAWLGYRSFTAARSIFANSNGGAVALNDDTLDPTQLKGEGDGRINILLLGIGGQGHEAPNLSDTIMVVSLDPKTKDVAMLSIPRDLYVKIPGFGYGKINAANAYGGPQLSSKVVSGIIGVPIHYYLVADFAGFKQAIDAVGGIDVNVPKAIYDPLYPCDTGNRVCPFQVKAGVQHMNGTTALRYARSRKTTSDFDRATRQQLIMAALRDKSLKVSTLTNPVKLGSLIDAVGSHVKTDLQPKEITKLAAIAKEVDLAKATQEVLDTEGEDSLLIDGSGRIAGAGSIELPRAGNFVYTDIQDFVKNIFVDHYITDENARLEIQNGSGIAGAASAVVKSLKSAHYNVGLPTNADDHYAKTVIYDYTGGKKPYTINYLEKRFGVKAQKMTVPSPSTSATGTPSPAPEIRIILGSNYKAPVASQ